MGWLIALAVIVLLAILPLGASVRYDAAGVDMKILLGPLRLSLRPGKELPKEEKPEPKKKTGKANGKAKAAGGSWTDFLPLVDIALDLLSAFRHKLRVRFLQLHLIMAGDDPCDLGINYGRAWAAIGNLLPRLEEFLIIQKKDVRVACDFEAEQTTVLAGLDITITLGNLLALAAVYGWKAVREWNKIQKIRKGGAVK